MKRRSSWGFVGPVVAVAALAVAFVGCAAPDSDLENGRNELGVDEAAGEESSSDDAISVDGDPSGDDPIDLDALPGAGSENVASSADALSAAQKTSVRDDIIAHGRKHLGAPYVFGASTSSTSSFDCSSFVKHLYATEAKITLPRTALNQSKEGTSVSLGSLQKGDLVFFKSTSRPVAVDHVGIYAGDGRILHTYKVGIGVTFSSFASGGYWRNHAVGARRFVN